MSLYFDHLHHHHHHHFFSFPFSLIIRIISGPSFRLLSSTLDRSSMMMMMVMVSLMLISQINCRFIRFDFIFSPLFAYNSVSNLLLVFSCVCLCVCVCSVLKNKLNTPSFSFWNSFGNEYVVVVDDGDGENAKR